ncbi:MAG TPA: deoxyribonuclease IV [Dermatophilaceae bacterium]|nr:deoxyribonuclease IV [Dermatophilaceae bacterium]
MAGGRIGVHVGARHDDADPLAEARDSGADAVQLFLADPQDWKLPKPHPRAAEIAATDLTVYVHAPYTINVATTNNRIRIPSRKLLAAHAKMAAELGAAGLIVHGGHVLTTEEEATGVDNWRKTFARQADEGGFGLPVLIENTAGGNHAMSRRLDAIGRLWDAIGEFGAGFTLDTCHAWAGGLDLGTAVEKITAVTGKVDLVHCNNSRDGADSGRDRHAPLREGSIPLDVLLEVVRSAGAPVVLETPGAAAERAAEVALLREQLG